MFESNKIIKITGDREEDLKNVLDLCFKLKEKVPNMFYIAENGALILGHSYSDEYIKKGWNKYPFTVNSEILTKIILQHLKEQKYSYYGYGDGSTHEGWQVSSPYSWSETHKTNDIYDYWFHAVVIIEPFVTYYSK